MAKCPNCEKAIYTLHGYSEQRYDVCVSRGQLITDLACDYAGEMTFECPECGEEIAELQGVSDDEVARWLEENPMTGVR